MLKDSGSKMNYNCNSQLWDTKILKNGSVVSKAKCWEREKMQFIE